jgi:pimeloyl-ACP methyl ester carboxylesterase
MPTPLRLRLLQTGLRTLGHLAPERAARAGFRLFTKPNRFQPKSWELAAAETARSEFVPGHSEARAAIALDGATPDLHLHVFEPAGDVARRGTVLLIHGWEGRGTQLAKFAPALRLAGLRVALLDLPAHGQSAGKQTSILEFIHAIHQAVAHLGDVRAIAGHSIGGMAAFCGAAKLFEVDRLVLLGSPGSVQKRIDNGAKLMTLPPRAVDAFQRELQRRIPAEIAEWEPLNLAPSANFQGLWFHDPEDSMVDYREAVAMESAWSACDLVTTPGLGHWRILRDEDVIDRATGFLIGAFQSERASA